MPTLEERLSALEREVTAIKLGWLAAQDKVEGRLSSIERDVKRDIRDIHQYLTMLMGLATVQNEDIKIVKEDIKSLKEDVGRLEVKSDEHTRVLDQHTELLVQILARLPEPR